jgi:hypothetical protein
VTTPRPVITTLRSVQLLDINKMGQLNPATRDETAPEISQSTSTSAGDLRCI